MKRKATIKDVAALAGVSKSTVSYVLSGKRSIGEEVTQKVLKAMEELSYKPSKLAQNLAKNKTNSIGFYGPSTRILREDLFVNLLLCGILDKIAIGGYDLILNTERTDKNGTLCLDLDKSHPIEGAIIMNPRIGDDYLMKLKNEDIPFVLVGRPTNDIDIFYVDNDNVASVYMAVDYLLDKGHKEIILINGPVEYTASEDRVKGYSLAMKENRYEFNERNIINVPILEEEGYRVCKKLIEDKVSFTAILTCNDIVSVGVMRALKECNRRIPDDVAVIGEGDTVIAKIHSPSITSINLQTYDVGVNAAGLLIDIINKRRMRESNIVVPSILVERDTT